MGEVAATVCGYSHSKKDIGRGAAENDVLAVINGMGEVAASVSRCEIERERGSPGPDGAAAIQLRISQPHSACGHFAFAAAQ